MTIEFQILGDPGRDNCVLASVNTGAANSRLLFDCGEGCLQDLSVSQLRSIDAVFFSHFHMDHIAGFDALFRHNFNRPNGPLRLFGPADAGKILGHRLQGFTWNLVDDAIGSVVIHELCADRQRAFVRYGREGFLTAHVVEEDLSSDYVYRTEQFAVTAIELDHGTPSIGYHVREVPRLNICEQAMREMGVLPGPWLQAVKDLSLPGSTDIALQDGTWKLEDLRRRLLKTSPGDSFAYLTDFSLDAEQETQLVDWLSGCHTLVCENNFRNSDRQLAERSHHLVSEDVGRIASKARVDRLILFHLSDRYSPQEWQDQLSEVKSIFADVQFPNEWRFDAARENG